MAGIIDTGVNANHPSFADIGGDGYDHNAPAGMLTYLGACSAQPVGTPGLCNDKLIGYYDFTGTSPEDDNGHGSHSDASYWIFLIHFPLLIAVAGAITVTPYPALIKYLLTLAVVVPIVFLTYHFVVRRPYPQ